MGQVVLRELSGEWLSRFLLSMRTDTRRFGAAAYLSALLDSDRRKSISAIAGRTGHFQYHRMHHFINSKSTSDEPIWTELLNYSVDNYKKTPGCLVIQDLVIEKRGDRSAGVAVQSKDMEGRLANCQIVRSLMIVRSGMVVPVAMRLVPPLVSDSANLSTAGVNKLKNDSLLRRSKSLIADIETLVGRGARIEIVIADLDHCVDPDFCRRLQHHGIKWLIRVPRNQSFKPIKDLNSLSIDSGSINNATLSGGDLSSDSKMLVTTIARNPVTTNWPVRAGLKFVREGGGLFWRNNARAIKRMQLVSEIYRNNDRTFYITNSCLGKKLHSIILVNQNYWFAKYAHTEMVRRYGFASFEGRSDIGLHRHLLMVCIAYVYNEHLRRDRGRTNSKWLAIRDNRNTWRNSAHLRFY